MYPADRGSASRPEERSDSLCPHSLLRVYPSYLLYLSLLYSLYLYVLYLLLSYRFVLSYSDVLCLLDDLSGCL